MTPDSLTRRDFTAAMFVTAGSFLLPCHASTPELAPTLQSDVMVRMRDGVRLATDIYGPDNPGRYPVILERTPYDKTAPSRSERTPSNPTALSRAKVADFFVNRGYVVVEGFYDQYVDAPMVHMSSWFDPYPRTATDNFIALSKRKRGPIRLILGPWTHGDRQLTYAGDVDFGVEATVDSHLAADFLTLRLRWFDRWLKGVKNGVDTEPAVRVFVMGGGSGRKNSAGRLDHGGRWRAEKSWPIHDTKWTPYYLHSGGLLSPVPPSTSAAFREYKYDVRVDAFPTSNLFARGHRIRLDVSSSNFPHFDANPNTGEPEARATSTRVATNRVYVDAARPSHVVLPVIPRRGPSRE